MLSLQGISSLNASLGNLAVALELNDSGAFTLFASEVWKRCVELNPELDHRIHSPQQEVFIGNLELHAYLKLHSAVSSYLNATHLGQVTPLHLKAIKQYLEYICDLKKINHEPITRYRPHTEADGAAKAPLASARTKG